MSVVCNTAWVGSPLPPVQRACLRSWIAHGHPVRLFGLGGVEGAPAGVEIVDVREVVPHTSLLRYANGSYALFSNLFRYKLQALGAGTWVDADVYCVRPMEIAGSPLFGIEAPGRLGTAVLRLSPDCPVLHDLLALFAPGGAPLPWAAPADQFAAGASLARTGWIDFSPLAWGASGPAAVTALAKKHGQFCRAQPVQVFYPVQWERCGWIAQPGISLEQVLSPQTRAVHLWNHAAKDVLRLPAPQGSFLHRLRDEGR